MTILHTSLFGNGRVDPVRPLQCPSYGESGIHPPGRVKLRVLEKDRERVSERESFPLPFTCCRNGCFIPVGGELVSTPSLSFVVPRDMTEIYGGRATTVAWGEGMACHATLMGMELGSVIPSHLHLGYQISCRPDPSG
ncbi:hypothetical protein BHM03_00046964 [Ensete ventricosum]|uniref:Uncharacterized protein n=1 Tax=Ensete ventricosum TaxID=4639 RepID=A0A445ML78_ENSVE|nr:hypothetical protein BHM03_00046964 [Ensete ventricosum]